MEDTDWGLRATSRGYRVAYLPAAKVLTPSCKSFPELAQRWDRHVAHEFRAIQARTSSRLRWVAGSVAVAASPLVEVTKVLRSDRISGARTRWLAFTCLARVRLHRARRMLELACRGDGGTLEPGSPLWTGLYSGRRSPAGTCGAATAAQNG